MNATAAIGAALIAGGALLWLDQLRRVWIPHPLHDWSPELAALACLVIGLGVGVVAG